MKKLLFATLCSAMFFGACSNEDSPIAEGPQLADNQFLLKLNAGDLNLVQSRAAAEGTEAVFRDTKVFLYDTSNSVIGEKTYTTDIFKDIDSQGSVTLNIPLYPDKVKENVNSVAVLSNISSSTVVDPDYPFVIDETITDNYSTLQSASLTLASSASPKWISLNKDVFLPFAASATGFENTGTATIKMQRKVARIDIYNSSSTPISIVATGFVSEYKSFIKQNNGTIEIVDPNSNVDMDQSVAIPAGKILSLYVLPKNQPDTPIEFVATVANINTDFDLPVVDPNKIYTYELKYTPTDGINVEFSVEKEWFDTPVEEITINVPENPLSAALPAEIFKSVEVTLTYAEAKDLNLLSVQSDDFIVSFREESGVTRAEGNKVVATVASKRYVAEPFTTSLLIEKVVGDRRIPVQTLPISQRPFQFNPIQMGSFIFMDRDLGASDVGKHGEVYVPGIGYIDQSGSNNEYRTEFEGGGRIPAATTNLIKRDKYFDVLVKDKKVYDPCPEGWHTMNIDEASLIFDYGTGTGSANGVANGNHDMNTGSKIGLLGLEPSINQEETILTLSGERATTPTGTLKFSLQHGHYGGGKWYGTREDFGPGWWVDGVGGDRYVTVTYKHVHETTHRIQCRPNGINRFDAARAFLVRCVSNKKVGE